MVLIELKDVSNRNWRDFFFSEERDLESWVGI